MARRLIRWLSLPREQRWLFIEAWCLFLKWDLLVSVVPYARWRDAVANSFPMEGGQSAGAQEAVSLATIRSLIDISETAARNHLRHMNCLRRCLCQQQLLARRNIPSTLHFGVMREEGKLKAHCWLTHQDALINDASDVVQNYTELEQTPERSIQSMLLKP